VSLYDEQGNRRPIKVGDLVKQIGVGVGDFVGVVTQLSNKNDPDQYAKVLWAGKKYDTEWIPVYRLGKIQ